MRRTLLCLVFAIVLSAALASVASAGTSTILFADSTNGYGTFGPRHYLNDVVAAGDGGGQIVCVNAVNSAGFVGANACGDGFGYHDYCECQSRYGWVGGGMGLNTYVYFQNSWEDWNYSGGHPGAITAVSASVRAPVSAKLRASFRALQAPAVTSVPAAIAAFAASPGVQQFRLNAAQARLVTAGGGDTATAAYLVPGDNSLCLWANGGATCQSAAAAATHGVTLQLLEPNGSSKLTPMPLPGTVAKSTVIGLAPDSVSAVSAPTSSGSAVRTTTSAGAFKLVGTGLQQLRFQSTSGSTTTPLAH